MDVSGKADCDRFGGTSYTSVICQGAPLGYYKNEQAYVFMTVPGHILADLKHRTKETFIDGYAPSLPLLPAYSA